MPPEPTDEPLEQGRNRSRHAQRSDASLPVCRAVQVAIHTRGGRGPGLIIREGIRQVGVTHTTPISPLIVRSQDVVLGVKLTNAAYFKNGNAREYMGFTSSHSIALARLTLR